LFGAWVRITGSGAGCGSHWPTCRGAILPRNPTTETIIEWSHRATSGILGLSIVALVAWGFVRFPRRSRVRAAVIVTLAMTFVEAGIGAGLVLKGLVARDQSVGRAIVIALHLISTFTLTAACALAAWWSGRIDESSRSQPRKPAWQLVASLAAVLVVSIAGAITALGDTLFPIIPTEQEGLFSGVVAGLDPAAHFLVRLRVLHPILSVIVAGALVALPNYVGAERLGADATRFIGILRLAVFAQLVVGSANILLGAPGWIQLVHLLVAQSIWLLLVLAAAASAEPRRLIP
jgi:heme A synthase